MLNQLKAAVSGTTVGRKRTETLASALIKSTRTLADQRQIDKDERRRVLFEDLYKTLVEAVPDKLNGTLLDFGCGHRDAAYVELYKNSFKNAYAVDVFDYSDIYQEDVKFLLSDGTTIPLPDNTCDLIVSHSVLEHVGDIGQSLSEINRVCKPGRFSYLTVSPLYFSPRGAHVASIGDWEHLNPGSKHYMMSQPIDRNGASLNQITMRIFMSAVFTLPWRVVLLQTKTFDKRPPDFAIDKFPAIDLLTKEFRIVLQKIAMPA